MRTKISLILFIGIVLGLLIVNLNMASTITTNCQTNSNINFRVTGVNWGNATHIISAGPGENDIPLTVSLESYGNSCTITDIEGNLQLSGGLSNINGTKNDTTYVQSVQLPSLFSMTFYLNIGRNQTYGQNTTLAYPLYIYWNATNTSSKYSQEINLEVPMHGSSNIKYMDNNPVLYSGRINDVPITIKNTGTGIVSNITTIIAETSGTSVLAQPNQISLLTPNQSYTMDVPIFVGAAAGQAITLNIDSSYINAYGYNTSSTYNLGFYTVASTESNVTVSLSNDSILSGVVNNASILIHNSGSYPVTNMTITLTPISTINFINSDGIINILNIAPGETVKVPLQIYVESSSSSNVGSISAALNYIQDGQSESSTSDISFLTPGDISITTVGTTVLPGSPTPGSIFSITSTFNNVGAQTADAVTLTPKPPKGISVIGDKTIFGGSIQSGSPTAFTMSFLVNSTATSGTYKIPVIMSYMNNLNSIINTTIFYTINVTNSNGNFVIKNGSTSTTTFVRNNRSGEAPYVLYIIIAIIIIILAYYLYKRRAHKNKTKVHVK